MEAKTTKTKHTTKKDKKNSYIVVKMFLLVLIVIAIIVIIYAYINKTYVFTFKKANTFETVADSNDKLSRIETLFLTENPVIAIENTEKKEDTQIMDEENTDIHNKLNNLPYNISLLESQVQEIKKSLEKQKGSTKNLTYIIISNRLINNLENGSPLYAHLESFINISHNDSINTLLETINPLSLSGVPTTKDLSTSFTKLYKEIYLNSLSDDKTFKGRLKYYFLHLAFIKNSQILDDSTQGKLNKIQLALNSNLLEEALNIVNTANFPQNIELNQWTSELKARINANAVVILINKEINDLIKKD